MSQVFALTRFFGIVVKEFLQLKRDRLTFGMIIGIPIIQLILFGYAINTNPKNLPTVLILGEQTFLTRSVESALSHSEYFALQKVVNEQEAKKFLAHGQVLFVVSIPEDFTKRLLRGERPDLLIEADATDPTATSWALGALDGLVTQVVNQECQGSLAYLQSKAQPFQFNVHRLYNPEGLTQYNIVPGLMGVILTLTMVMMTGLTITRERERGTMENLLATPVSPLEIMSGKIVPYVLIGHIQAAIILLFALALFEVPFQGNPVTLYVAAILFIAANLTVGVTLSSFAKNQLQALQMTIFYFLPNLMLSGFMFPFAGMPKWAQYLGNVLPLTHFNRAVRGILLKGASWADSWENLWPILVFTVVLMSIATICFKRTLD